LLPDWGETDASYALAVYAPVRGRLTLAVNGRRWTARAGQALIVNPRDAVAYPPDQAFPLEYRLLIFEQPFLRGVREALDLPASWGGFGFTPGPHPWPAALRPALRQWEAGRHRGTELGGRAHAVMAGQELFIALLKHRENTLRRAWEGRGGDATGVQDPRVRRALRFLASRLATRVTVAEAARHAGVGQRWLEGAFQRALGVSPKQHVIAMRMREAGLLLRNPDLSVEEVARRVGYPDVRAFRRVFRARFRRPPSTGR
jgi:AraC-like DNA-binding protein